MNRSFAHWNLRYARDRLRLFAYSLSHPGAPWLAPDAIRFLERWLQPDHIGFEWGAGRSTLWFSHRVERLTSIEHNEHWHARVQQMVLAQPRNNIELRHIPLAIREIVNESHPSHDSHPSHVADPASAQSYASAINTFPDASLNFVLVDGVSDLRDACALAAIPRIRSGGALIIDDIHRYLPSDSRAPLALSSSADPLTPLWDEVIARLDSWDYTGFSSGVTDTGIWLKN